ncbi:MAG: tyrosine-type recombinase/integrase [Paracoccus sp. (in: a-proteobacteria)]
MPPRQINRLTARGAAAITKPGRHADGGGLYLKVAASGSKSWIFFYQFAGRQREMGLGPFGDVTLAEARDKAIDARRLIAAEIDPLDHRRAAQAAATVAATTFGAFADSYVAQHRPSWSNEKHAAQWAMTLGDAYCKTLRPVPIADVGLDAVLAVLQPVWQKRPETARRVRMRIEKVLDAAKVRNLRTGENPARGRGNLDHILPRHQAGKAGHHSAMPWASAPGYFQTLDRKRGVAAAALRFTIATAARTGEVLGATWAEIDTERALWTIPAGRMKARRDHRVPLSAAALAALEGVRGLSPEIVFPGQNLRAPLSNMTMAAVLKRDKVDATVHGFRSSFRDWAAETTSFPAEIAEMALAHVVGNATEAAYRRGDLFEKRRALMDAWSDFLTGAEAENVVPITGRQR